MKRSTVLGWFCVLTLAFAGSAAAAPQSGFTTINLRTWTCFDTSNDACQLPGEVALDGVTVCLRSAGELEQCAVTEDGEWWIDSQPHGSYWARVEPPTGYKLVTTTCTTFPDLPYGPCQVHGPQVHVVVHKGETAVTVNFLLVRTSAPQ